MRYRLGSALLGLALAVSMTATALAQTEDDTPAQDDSTAIDTSAAAPVDISMPAPVADPTAQAPLFLQLTLPSDLDVTVPLKTAQLPIIGLTVPGAVVSVDGDLADVDAQGNFTDSAALDEGANEIEVVASDSQGKQLTTTLFVVRGE